MKKFFVPALVLAAASLFAPSAQAQLTLQSACQQLGLTYNPGPPATCTNVPSTSAPEISASASIGGTAVLLCGAFMLRRRKRTAAVAL